LEKAPEAFRTISEVAEELNVPQHVLRFWETRFSQIRPMKRGGGRRYYRVNDVELLKGIRQLLYGKGYTIKGVQRILKERGVAHVSDIGRGEEVDTQPDVITSTKSEVSAPVEVVKGRSKTPSATPVQAETSISGKQREDLELALEDLAAAKRILTGEKKT
jgi:DNA-binding transcriptional MerR regulator